MKTFLIIILLFILTPISAQVNRAEITGAYIVNLAKYVTWPNEQGIDSLHIHLIGNDINLLSIFKILSEETQIKRKSIKITNNTSAKIPSTTNIIFISQDYSDLLTKVYPYVEKSPILLVSENYVDKRWVMINLYDAEKSKIHFEINKANLTNQNLSIDPEILLLGGTEIDLIQLYRQSQHSLNNIQEDMNAMTDSLKRLNKTIKRTNEQLNKKQENIAQQEQLLLNYENEKLEEKQEIDNLNKKIIVINHSLRKQKDSMEIQSRLYLKQQDKIQNQYYDLEIGKENLEIQESNIDSLNIKIIRKNEILDKQILIISRQKQVVYLFLSIAILMIILVISVYRSYKSKRKANAKLEQQKHKTDEVNWELQSKNEELSHIIEKLKETQSQLIQSEKMASLGILTAGIAHEINNPLNFIYSGANILETDLQDLIKLLNTVSKINDKTIDKDKWAKDIKLQISDCELHELIEIIPNTIKGIQTGVERTAEIVKGLSNFSRIEKKEKQIANIHEGIDSALLLLRNKYKNRIEITKNLGKIPSFKCFPSKLNQVFINILNNAIDAIKNEGEITISTILIENSVRIMIKDTGTGIKKEDLAKIFDPFFTTKEVGKGTGLGLSITFGIIKEHNGTINVNSEIGIGTEFTIKIPILAN